MKQMEPGTMYKQRDIVLIPFPYSDLTDSTQRPALIISNNKMDKMQDLICCLITRNPNLDCLLIKKDCFEEGKLPFKSWIKPYRIFTVHKKIIKKKICTINNNFYKEVFNEIKKYLE